MNLQELANKRIQNFFEINQNQTQAEKNVLLSLGNHEASICQKCKLCSTRTHVVYGDGDPSMPLMVIGEGPGQTEDETGIPFVGKAGQLLDKILFAMGLNRRLIYITNIVKCRPPNNRNPEPDEVEACRHYLDEQIEIIKPQLLLILGSPAIKSLLNTEIGISKLRGEWHQYKNIPMLPTYHPSYLLRDPSHKKETWEDVKKVMSYLREKGFYQKNPFIV